MIRKYAVLLTTLLALIIFFLFYASDWDTKYIIPMRFNRLITILIGSICVAYSSIIFQTLLGNRILTPSIMGYESIYLLFQVLLQLLGGTAAVVALGITGNFILSTAVMLIYSLILYRWIFPLLRGDTYLLLLFGLVFSLVVMTFSQFFQLLISPSEFSVFQGFTYTTFNRAKPELLWIAGVIVSLVVVIIFRRLAALDVLLLGSEQSTSLGVSYPKNLKKLLLIISVLVALSTSLIGVTAFMGVFVVNITYAVCNNYRHFHNLNIGFLITSIFFLIAQILVEHVFNYKTTVSILINLFCGGFFLIYMIYRGKNLNINSN